MSEPFPVFNELISFLELSGIGHAAVPETDTILPKELGCPQERRRGNDDVDRPILEREVERISLRRRPGHETRRQEIERQAADFRSE